MGFLDFFKSKTKKAAEEKETDDFFREMEQLAAQAAREEGTIHDMLPNGKGEFGLNIHNPIPVKSIPDSQAYLANLVFEKMADSDTLSFHRKGSGAADMLKLPVDIYEVSDQNGNSETIYIWPYNKVNSKKVPNGFKFKSN